MLLLATLVFAAVPARGDDVSAYLERLGLDELLARHLDSEMQAATGDERDALRDRLGKLIAELLERVTDVDRQKDLEARGRALLEGAPIGATAELRLALMRASYRTAERVSEQHRLALADDASVAVARETLDTLVAEMNTLRTHLIGVRDRAERQLGRASGLDAVRLGETANEAKVLLDRSTFLFAWVLYYRAWLDDRADNARLAEDHFATLLELEPGEVRPDLVSVDLRSNEAVARCILGMALCRSLTVSAETALQWLALLEHPGAWKPLRDQLDVWRLVLLLDHGAYVPAHQELDRLLEAAQEPDDVPATWLRLVAVQSLRGQDRSRHAAALARRAVTTLALRGELEQVYDLAERFGLDALGTRGFAFSYVGGVLALRDARVAHPGEMPPTDPDHIALFETAKKTLAAALQAADVKEYADAEAECRRLIAQCSFALGSYLEAEGEFTEAAARLTGDAAAETAWMAIVSLDRHVTEAEDDVAAAERLASLMDGFLEQYPASRHAPTLILRRALATDERSPAVARELLSIPETSDARVAARQQAARIYYHLFREGDAAERTSYGNEYLLTAMPLFMEGGPDFDAAGADAAIRLAWARSILEVALSRNLRRLVAARQVLDRLERWLGQYPEVIGEMERELVYRRLQERTWSEDHPAARALADRLWREDATDPWSERAVRTVFRSADRRWREAKKEGTDDRDAVASVARYGQRMIEFMGSAPEELEDRNVLSVHVTTARALERRWTQGLGEAEGRGALEIYEKLLAYRPRNAAFLRACANLAESFGEKEKALGWWRRLVAGLDGSREEWFEARFKVVRLLEESDPDRARDVLVQHRQLHPEYGPDPWGARLRHLHMRLDPSLKSKPAEPTDAEGGDDG